MSEDETAFDIPMDMFVRWEVKHTAAVEVIEGRGLARRDTIERF